VVKAYVEHLN